MFRPHRKRKRTWFLLDWHVQMTLDLALCSWGRVKLRLWSQWNASRDRPPLVRAWKHKLELRSTWHKLGRRSVGERLHNTKVHVTSQMFRPQRKRRKTLVWHVLDLACVHGHIIGCVLSLVTTNDDTPPHTHTRVILEHCPQRTSVLCVCMEIWIPSFSLWTESMTETSMNQWGTHSLLV